jgi:hypothetical protein
LRAFDPAGITHEKFRFGQHALAQGRILDSVHHDKYFLYIETANALQISIEKGGLMEGNRIAENFVFAY